MAVDITPRFTFYRQTTGLSLPVTFCGWFRFDSTPAAYRTLHVQAQNSYGNHVGLFRNSAGRLVVSDSTGDKVTSDVLSNSTWYFAAVVAQTGTNNLKLYWRASGSSSLTSGQGTLGAFTYSNEQMVWCGGPANSPNQGLGEDAAHSHDGGIAYGRVFSGALTSSDLLTESTSTTAVASEWADWPFTNTSNSTSDVSGNSRTLTSVGTGSQANDTDPTITIGTQVTAIAETDALVAATRSGSKAAALVTETDALVAATRTHSADVAAITEADVIAPAVRSASQAVGVLVEADVLAPVARSSVQTVGLISEIDQLAAASTPSITAALSEADLLLPVSHSTSHAVGTLAEIDALAPAVVSTPDDISVVVGPSRLGWSVLSTRDDRGE